MLPTKIFNGENDKQGMIKNLGELCSHGRKELRRMLLPLADTLLEEINAGNIVKERVKLVGDSLQIGSQKWNLRRKRIFVVGFGKASLPMAQSLRDILGNRIIGGIINTPFPGNLEGFKINVLPHPLPDKRTVKASREILEFVKKLKKNDLLIVLISGGASALFEVPNNMSIGEERRIVDKLLRSGADIKEINKIRIAISAVKGGKFLRYVNSAHCIALIISDVLGPPQLVGSGPTYPQSYDISEIVEKYGLQGIPSIQDMGSISTECTNVVLADNTYALKKGKILAEKMGIPARIFPHFLKGEPSQIYRHILEMAEKGELLLFGGETTVNVGNSKGLGGRNQEFVLYLAREAPKNSCFICLGTDGIDGPTDAAGGIGDDLSLARIKKEGVDIDKELSHHNSYYVLKKIGDLVITGYTGTNLADICIFYQAKAP